MSIGCNLLYKTFEDGTILSDNAPYDNASAMETVKLDNAY